MLVSGCNFITARLTKNDCYLKMYDVKKNSFASTLLIHIYQNFIITKNQHFLTMKYSSANTSICGKKT